MARSLGRTRWLGHWVRRDIARRVPSGPATRLDADVSLKAVGDLGSGQSGFSSIGVGTSKETDVFHDCVDDVAILGFRDWWAGHVVDGVAVSDWCGSCAFQIGHSESWVNDVRSLQLDRLSLQFNTRMEWACWPPAPEFFECSVVSGKRLFVIERKGRSLEEGGFDNLSSIASVTDGVFTSGAVRTTDLGQSGKVDGCRADISLNSAASAEEADTGATSTAANAAGASNHVQLAAGERESRRVLRRAVSEGNDFKTHVVGGSRRRVEVSSSQS